MSGRRRGRCFLLQPARTTETEQTDGQTDKQRDRQTQEEEEEEVSVERGKKG